MKKGTWSSARDVEHVAGAILALASATTSARSHFLPVWGIRHLAIWPAAKMRGRTGFEKFVHGTRGISGGALSS